MSAAPNSAPIFIGGYEGSGFQDATVTFARAIDTNTGIGLPQGSYTEEAENNLLDYTRLYMPDDDDDGSTPFTGTDRIGAFNCIVDNQGVVYDITTITMDKQGNCNEVKYCLK